MRFSLKFCFVCMCVAYGCPIVQAPCVKKTILSPFDIFVKISWAYMHGSISGFPVVFHLSMHLSLHLYHLFLITVEI